MNRILKVCLDLTPLQSPRTGVDRYLITLVKGLARVDDTDLQLTILVNSKDRSEIEEIVEGRFPLISSSLGGRLGRVLSTGVVLPWLTARNGFTVVHSPSFVMPPIRGGARHLLTVFDMTMHTIPQYHTRLHRSRLFRAAISWSIRRADIVVVPTKRVRSEILRLDPKVEEARVRTIPLGLDPCFEPTALNQKNHNSEAGRDPFMLFVGTLEPRKNVGALLKAYRQAVDDFGVQHKLVLVGSKGWGADQELAVLNTPWFRDHVQLTGYVPQDTLVNLYRAASLFVYPSVEEGFGYPPLEAMACGTPVIASKTPALQENLEGAAVLIPPDDTAALARAMAGLIRDPDEQNRLSLAGTERARQFGAEEAARRTVLLYREIKP